jgi:predicted RNA-binding Zn-ribbon protein involved in translation (DUF1610 family)
MVVTFTVTTISLATSAALRIGDHHVTSVEFERLTQDDGACLELLWRARYSPDGTMAHCPECDEQRIFRHYKSKVHRRAWGCTACGHYLYPTAGTIFHKSSTPLHTWFSALQLLVDTGRPIPPAILSKELGVTYKTASRMTALISKQLEVDLAGSRCFHPECVSLTF